MSTDTAKRIQAVQAMRRKAAMSDDDFTALKLRLTNKASTTKMTGVELDRVAAELKRLYPDLAKPARRREAAPAKSRAAQWSKIDALLFDAGRTRAYLDGRIKSQVSQIDAWEFADCKILDKVIAALSIDQRRRKKKGAKK